MGALPQSTDVSPEDYLLLENDRADNAEKCEYIKTAKVCKLRGHAQSQLTSAPNSHPALPW